MNSLEVKNVSYSIGNKIILRDVNLNFTNGIYALLGLNGAGKTTLMNILSSLIEPTKGRILYNNLSISLSPHQLREDLSYMPQSIGLIQSLSVYDNLYYFGLLKGCNKKQLKITINDLIENFNLSAEKNNKLQNLSGGLKQRVCFALALLNNPKVLILDEPVNNLDYLEREKLYQLLKEISKNCIIIISTHLINEIEGICKEYIFIEEGKVKINENI